MKEENVQVPIVGIGTELSLGDHKATVTKISQDGVELMVEGLHHHPVVSFESIETAITQGAEDEKQHA